MSRAGLYPVMRGRPARQRMADGKVCSRPKPVRNDMLADPDAILGEPRRYDKVPWMSSTGPWGLQSTVSMTTVKEQMVNFHSPIPLSSCSPARLGCRTCGDCDCARGACLPGRPASPCWTVDARNVGLGRGTVRTSDVGNSSMSLSVLSRWA